jgi:predicted alpha/beta-hydrolase family hydrolase
MQKWKLMLTQLGDVLTFDYNYMIQGRRRPDPLPQLIATHRNALDTLRAKASGPVFLIGKSMGGRIGCHVALEDNVNGLICLGYPLCAMGDRSKLRDEVLLGLRTPILFLQGTRDVLCPPDLLEMIRAKMTAQNFLDTVDGGDHSLLVRKKDLGGKTQDDVDQKVLEAVETFVAQFSATI